MKERPIIFSSEMIRAILDGRKTMTRRVVKPQPVWEEDPVRQDEYFVGRYRSLCGDPENPDISVEVDSHRCPYGVPGDRIWVRENGWERPELTSKMIRDGADTWPRYEYDVNPVCSITSEEMREWSWKRRPSIHMPRWASRITLEITNIRVERLQDISEEDAKAEGVWCGIDCQPEHRIAFGRLAFGRLWETFHGEGSWEANPWVWVISFRRVEG